MQNDRLPSDWEKEEIVDLCPLQVSRKRRDRIQDLSQIFHDTGRILTEIKAKFA